jgi:hypothetical protein
MGFNERPMRHLPAFMALKPTDRHPKAPTLEHPKDPDISSLHNFIQNKQPPDRCPASCKLGSLNDVFASCPATNFKKPWWRRTGSNRRPPACKAGALPAELRPRKVKDNSLAILPTRRSLARPTGRRGSCRALAEHRVEDPLMRER